LPPQPAVRCPASTPRVDGPRFPRQRRLTVAVLMSRAGSIRNRITSPLVAASGPTTARPRPSAGTPSTNSVAVGRNVGSSSSVVLSLPPTDPMNCEWPFTTMRSSIDDGLLLTTFSTTVLAASAGSITSPAAEPSIVRAQPAARTAAVASARIFRDLSIPSKKARSVPPSAPATESCVLEHVQRVEPRDVDPAVGPAEREPGAAEQSPVRRRRTLVPSVAVAFHLVLRGECF